MEELEFTDLTSEEAQSIVNDAKESITRSLAQELAKEIDPSGQDVTLVDDIVGVLMNDQEYLDSLENTLSDGEEGNEDGIGNGETLAERAEDIMQTIAQATGRLVPAAVSDIIEGAAEKMEKISDITKEHLDAEEGARKAAKYFRRGVKWLDYAETYKQYSSSDDPSTEAMKLYVEKVSHGLVVVVAGVGAGILLGPELLAAAAVVGVGVLFAPHAETLGNVIGGGLAAGAKGLGQALGFIGDFIGYGYGVKDRH
ncbi:MAG: hypothetical protein ACRBDL_06760 [Alphaproteobacteria bacterium]